MTAGLDEQWRRERDENRQLWRDTQRQIDAVGQKIADTNDVLARLTMQLDRFVLETSNKIGELAESDRRLAERIETLVSAVGQLIAKKK